MIEYYSAKQKDILLMHTAARMGHQRTTLYEKMPNSKGWTLYDFIYRHLKQHCYKKKNRLVAGVNNGEGGDGIGVAVALRGLGDNVKVLYFNRQCQ